MSNHSRLPSFFTCCACLQCKT